MQNNDQWERQPGESPKALEAFSIYRDMGADRSTSKVARQLGKNRGLILRWCSRWEWVERCAAYDGYLDRVQRLKHEAAIAQARETHIRLARSAQDHIAARLAGMDPEEIAASNIPQWLKATAEVELRALGDEIKVPVEITGKGGGPVEQVIRVKWEAYEEADDLGESDE